MLIATTNLMLIAVLVSIIILFSFIVLIITTKPATCSCRDVNKLLTWHQWRHEDTWRPKCGVRTRRHEDTWRHRTWRHEYKWRHRMQHQNTASRIQVASVSKRVVHEDAWRQGVTWHLASRGNGAALLMCHCASRDVVSKSTAPAASRHHVASQDVASQRGVRCQGPKWRHRMWRQ